MAHGQINDAIYDALVGTYGPGALNDMLIKFYQAQPGVTGQHINDAEDQFLDKQVIYPDNVDTIQDKWFHYLGTLGYTGALNDRLLAYWKSFNPE